MKNVVHTRIRTRNPMLCNPSIMTQNDTMLKPKILLANPFLDLDLLQTKKQKIDSTHLIYNPYLFFPLFPFILFLSLYTRLMYQHFISVLIDLALLGK